MKIVLKSFAVQCNECSFKQYKFNYCLRFWSSYSKKFIKYIYMKLTKQSVNMAYKSLEVLYRKTVFKSNQHLCTSNFKFVFLFYKKLYFSSFFKVKTIFSSSFHFPKSQYCPTKAPGAMSPMRFTTIIQSVWLFVILCEHFFEFSAVLPCWEIGGMGSGTMDDVSCEGVEVVMWKSTWRRLVWCIVGKAFSRSIWLCCSCLVLSLSLYRPALLPSLSQDSRPPSFSHTP